MHTYACSSVTLAVLLNYMTRLVITLGALFCFNTEGRICNQLYRTTVSDQRLTLTGSITKHSHSETLFVLAFYQVVLQEKVESLVDPLYTFLTKGR